MHEQSTTTLTMEISEVERRLAGIVDQVSSKETRVLVEKRGVPVAAIISVDDLNRFVQLERERAERFSVIDRVREAFKDVPSEEIETETDRIIARDRAADRAAAEDVAATG